jgi:WD40 repeat protein
MQTTGDKNCTIYTRKIESINDLLNFIALCWCVSGGLLEELLFWDIKTGQQITSTTQMRDVKWSTSRCSIGWSVQVLPNYMCVVIRHLLFFCELYHCWYFTTYACDIHYQGLHQTSSIHSASHVTCSDRTSDNKYLVSGDDAHRLRLFRFPCPSEVLNKLIIVPISIHVYEYELSYLHTNIFVKLLFSQGFKCKEYKGHADDVSNVVFSVEDSHVFSVGGQVH